MEGLNFVNKCLESKVHSDPWPHQIVEDTISIDIFEKLKSQCESKLNFETDKLVHIHPKDYAQYGTDFYEETVDICKHLLEKSKALHEVYPAYRQYSRLGVNAHISITPPLPYKFYIHQEGLEKTWSAVTYITPEKNVGTKMYSEQKEDTLVKEAVWKPNSTFIFCGQQGKTWHSYESDQSTNRITFNLFIMKYREQKCFYSD